MKPTQIKITDDGLFGQAVYTYIKPILYQQGNLMLDEINNNSYQENMQEYDRLVKEFITNNPPYPLTEKGEPGKVCEAMLIPQFTDPMQRFESWHKCEIVGNEYIVPTGCKTRQAFEVISNKQKMAEKKKPCIECGDRDYLNCNFCKPVAEQSIEEIAMNEAINLFHCYPLPNDNYTYEAVRKQYVEGAKFGANHILNAKGLVSKDRIVDIEKLALVLISDMQLNKPLGYALYINKLMGIIDLLNQIKDIK